MTTNPNANALSDDEELTDVEILNFLLTIFFVTVGTVSFFALFHHRARNHNGVGQPVTASNTTNHSTRPTSTSSTTLQRNNTQSNTTTTAVGGDMRSTAADSVVLSSDEGKYLMDGIIPYRYGKAKQWKLTPSLQEKRNVMIAAFQSENGPFCRGCNVVITIRATVALTMTNAGGDDETEATTTRKKLTLCDALTILGSEFNLFVILALPSDCGMDEFSQASSSYLSAVPEDILPRHRIIAAKSTTGRIALVRQLRPGVMYDYDTEVEKQLTRFGFKVVLYGEEGLADFFDKKCN